MRTGVIAKKVGMTRLFQADGRHVPVTVLQLDGLQVIGRREMDRDGYTAVQLGAGTAKAKNIAKPQRVAFGKAEVEPKAKIVEFRVAEDALLDVGSRIPVATSAIGRAWLALAGERERQDVLERVQEVDEVAWPELQRAITRAVDDHHTLGVATSFGEWQKDVNGIARAFRPGGGLPPMAISCGGPASSLGKDFLMKEVAPRLVQLTQRLEESLPR